MKINFFSILFSFNIIFTNILATEIDSSFIVQWHDSTWGEGGLFPAGPAWNMVGPYDFDNDGFGDFVVSAVVTFILVVSTSSSSATINVNAVINF